MMVHDENDNNSNNYNYQTLESDLHALTSELGEVDRRLALLRLSLPPAYSRCQQRLLVTLLSICFECYFRS